MANWGWDARSSQARPAPTWHRYSFSARASMARDLALPLPATNPGAQLCRLHCSTHNGHKGHVCTDYQIRPLYVQIDIVMFQVLLASAAGKLIECCRQCRLRDFFRTPKTRRAKTTGQNCWPWHEQWMAQRQASWLADSGQAEAGRQAEVGRQAGRDLQQF